MESNNRSTDSVENQNQTLFQDTGQSTSILINLNNMRKKGLLTDTTVHVGRQRFPCHRAILACCSEYFLAMFSSNLRESGEGEVYIENINPKVLEMLIEYAYTSTIVINAANAQELLEVAHRLQFEKIVRACCDFIESNLDLSNCLGVLRFADKHSCSMLYKAALKFSLERFEEVCQQEEFQQLSFTQLAEYLSRDALHVRDEEAVYRSLMLWMDSNKDFNSSSLHLLLRCVRLHYLSPKLLQSLADIPEVSQCQSNLDLIREAIDTQKRLQNGLDDVQCVSCAKPRLSTMEEVMVVVGGYGANHGCITDVRFLNPVAKKWETFTRIPEPLSGFSVTNLDSSIYVIGGKLKTIFSSSVYRYDYENDKWHTMADMSCSRQYHSSAVIGKSIYVAGGEQKLEFVSEVESFNASTNKWTTVTNLPQPVSGPAVATHRLKLYVIGGQESQSTTYGHIQCFDTEKVQWSIIKTVPITSRHFPALTLNGYIYILGGCGRNGIQVYDPDTDSCLPPMNMSSTERHLFAAAAIKSRNLILVAGGMRNYQALTTAEAFHPLSNSWSSETEMPHALRVHGCGVSIRKYLGPPFY
ncbi:kelch-like protein 25 [Asterias rubens]|uniref:kelch-like protein 25 n=1 Tax=Asterias rubens TaxID=7604 RepID=UPI0014552934|nr:kelch-like protein 25 [Asterias rubens]